MATAAVTFTTTTRMPTITMLNALQALQPLAFLRLQTWLSPAFPIGSYSYSHGLEWAVEAGYIKDRASLVDWLSADLRYGTGRNDAIFYSRAWSAAVDRDFAALLDIAELAASYRGTSEFALESSQQGSACQSTLRQVWPTPLLDWLSKEQAGRRIPSSLAVILGIASAEQHIPLVMALPAFLQSYVTGWVTAGVRLVPLGQTDGQMALAALEDAILATSSDTANATMDDLGSAGFMAELASMAHETQYTRLFRS